MKHFRGFVVAAVVAGLVAAASGGLAATPKPKTVAFKGAYAGQVTEKVDGTNVTGLANGAGASTVVGKGKLIGTASGTTANPPCSPLNGTGTLTGPKGNLKVSLLTTSRACAASAEDQDNISIVGDAKANGGTKIFRKAKGKLHFSGHYDRKAGTFSVKFSGKLTY
jgi:hypothetical protein